MTERQSHDPGGDRTHDLLIKSPFLARDIAQKRLNRATKAGHSVPNCARGRARNRADHTPAYRYGTLVNQACEESRRIIEEAGKGRRLPGGKA